MRGAATDPWPPTYPIAPRAPTRATGQHRSCPDPGPGGALQALGRVREALQAQPLADGSLRLGFSAGITEHPVGEALDVTLERADRALYAAKAAGRQRTEVLSVPAPRERPLVKPAQV